MPTRTKNRPMTVGGMGKEALIEAARGEEEARNVLPAEKIPADGVNSPATGTEVVQATQALPEVQEAAQGVVLERVQDFRRYVVKKPATRSMTIRVPETLYDDLVVIQRMTGRTMTDVIVSGTTPLVAELMERAVEGKR
jgi:hypothetical protein